MQNFGTKIRMKIPLGRPTHHNIKIDFKELGWDPEIGYVWLSLGTSDGLS
jgi:hypothetical protein